jgi:hypothetical protein
VHGTGHVSTSTGTATSTCCSTTTSLARACVRATRRHASAGARRPAGRSRLRRDRGEIVESLA